MLMACKTETRNLALQRPKGPDNQCSGLQRAESCFSLTLQEPHDSNPILRSYYCPVQDFEIQKGMMNKTVLDFVCLTCLPDHECIIKQ